MNHSANYNLNKPEKNEQFNLDDWNNNTDAIDTAMNTNKTNIASNASNISAILTGLSTVNASDTSSVFYKLMKLVYPVGSLYWSSKGTNPSALFGGTWVQIKDKFILACGDTYKTTGATGGASTVTLSVSNMPSHSHSFTPSGTITMNAHSHGLNNHTHSFTPSGTTASGGQHYHYFEFRDDSSSWGTSSSNNIVNAYHTTAGGEINYDTPDIWKPNGTDIFYPSLSGTNTGLGFLFDTEGNSRYAPYPGLNNHVLTNGYQGATSWSGYHNHQFIGANGKTGGSSGNTTSTTSSGTFKGTAGTTGGSGSGTSFSIMPPYIVKYCWERTA